MGYYINQTSKGEILPAKGKVKMLLDDGAITTSPTFQENLVCVVENNQFEAALYCCDERELARTLDPQDLRKKTYLLYQHAKRLSGYKE